MVGGVSSSSNLMNMISQSYQSSDASVKGMGQGPPPPPPSGTDGASEDPLGVLSTVDSDGDSVISEDEYNALTEGILEVTGYQSTSSFTDFDSDEDGMLSGDELRSVLDEAGFAPPPPPPASDVISAYDTQSSDTENYDTGDSDMMAQLMEYLQTKSEDLDITA